MSRRSSGLLPSKEGTTRSALGLVLRLGWCSEREVLT